MAIISEHEQVTNYDRGTPSEQPEEQQSLVKKCRELLSRAKKHRKRYDQDWQYNYEFVCLGRQWPMERARWRFSEVVNMTWAAIMTEIAIQTDSRPKFEYSYEETSDEAFSKILSEINTRNWDKYKWSSVVSDGLFDCKLYHVAHAIIEWNPELEEGLGDVEFRILDPYCCYWDPRSSDVNKGKKARHFIYAEPVPTAELKLKYPEFKEKLKPDISTFGPKSDGMSVGPVKAFLDYDPYPPSRIPTGAQGNTDELYGGEPHTLLERYWLRDDTLEELCQETEELDENGEKKKEYFLKKKYPKGRYIEIANNCVLKDTTPGVEIDGQWVEYECEGFPIARLVNYAYPREYAGENEVTHTKGPQKMQNYIWSYILDMFKTQANPITVIGDASGLDEDAVLNEPGSIWQVTDVSQVRREPGTPLTPGSFDLLSQSKTYFDQIQGLQDVQRGADLSNVNSAIMLEGYIEAAQTRPRMKNRNLDQFLQDAGELVLLRMLQFYTQPRVYRVTNKEGWPEQIEFYIPKDEQGNKVAKMRRYTNNPDGSQTEMMNKTMEIKGIPDVRVISGSQLPYAKAQKADTALKYFNAGAIDGEELLKSVDWPNWESVLKRLQMKAEQEAQAAAAEQGAPKGA